MKGPKSGREIKTNCAYCNVNLEGTKGQHHYYSFNGAHYSYDSDDVIEYQDATISSDLEVLILCASCYSSSTQVHNIGVPKKLKDNENAKELYMLTELFPRYAEIVKRGSIKFGVDTSASINPANLDSILAQVREIQSEVARLREIEDAKEEHVVELKDGTILTIGVKKYIL